MSDKDINSNISLIYIAGTGRSGSTLLDRVCSANDSVVGAGELSQFYDVYLKSDIKRCGCGQTVLECPVWGNIYHALDVKFNVAKSAEFYRQNFRALENLKALYPRFAIDNQIVDEYHEHITEILQLLINKHSGSKYILDSSTSSRLAFFRPLALKRFARVKNIKLIHLTRDPRGIIYGFLKRPANKRTGEWLNVGPLGLYTLVKWYVVNMCAFLQSLYFPRRDYLYLSYEDIIDDPLDAFKKITEFLEISEIPNKITEEGVMLCARGHQLTGNMRVLKQNPLYIKADKLWHDGLAVPYKLFAIPFIFLWHITFGFMAKLRSFR